MYYCLFQAGLCQFSSHRHFCVQRSSPSARSKFLSVSCNSLNNQLHSSSMFTLLVSDSTTNWLLLFTVHFRTPAMTVCHLNCIPTPQHVSFALPLSTVSLNLVSTLLSPLVIFGMLVPLFGTSYLLFSDLSTLTLPSNPISNLTRFVLRAILAPNNLIHALLINTFMLILALE